MILRGATSRYATWTAEEDAVLRADYERVGAAGLRKRFAYRSISSIASRAARMGLKTRRFWTATDDAQLRDLWDSGKGLTEIANRIGRAPGAVHDRASKIGLRTGCPVGLEYLTTAASRLGYARATLRRILQWAGVPLRVALAMPAKRKWHCHCVDAALAEDAVDRWQESEPVETAARRIGVTRPWLMRRLILAGMSPPPRYCHWRVSLEDIAKALAVPVRGGRRMQVGIYDGCGVVGHATGNQ